MGVLVLFFGQLTDITGCASLRLAEEVQDTDQLNKLLKERYPSLQRAKYVITVNRSIIQGKKELKGNPKVALLPPFSGG